MADSSVAAPDIAATGVRSWNLMGSWYNGSRERYEVQDAEDVRYMLSAFPDAAKAVFQNLVSHSERGSHSHTVARVSHKFFAWSSCTAAVSVSMHA